MNSGESGRAEVDPSVRLRAFGFDDVHPLWGGRSLWATEDLAAEVCVVEAAQVSQRLRLILTPDEWALVERIVGESGLLTSEIPQRNGVPDEGRPSITLALASGETVVFAKWANDRVPAFDRVLEALSEFTSKCKG